MDFKYHIAGYARISVDEEIDRDNTSIENQKAIISEFVKRKFPKSELDFYEDRDKSGYTFEQRDGYQEMRKGLMSLKYDMLIVKDFSRFSRRNSKGLVELEDLRDAGVRIISIGDSIDYPTYDDWTAIQFRFLINEMPVTDASKKVKAVIDRRQNEGKWICAVPYGYIITNYKTMAFEVEEAAAAVIREIFSLYNDGWGYKKIANYLTAKHIPTPRMCEKQRKEAAGEEYRIKVRPEWSIVTVSDIIANDFYIGTLRQRKYTRKKINGSDKKLDESEHIVFENHHEPIIDYRTFATAQQELKMRTTSNYRGVKKKENPYTGFLECGDCGAPMFLLGRKNLPDSYRCGRYHQYGKNACSSHHIRTEVLDALLKSYIQRVRDNSAGMIAELEKSIQDEVNQLRQPTDILDSLQKELDDARDELRVLTKQKTRDMLRSPEQAQIIGETYDELTDETTNRIAGLENQMELIGDRRNKIIETNRTARTVLQVFDSILSKERLEKADIGFIVEKLLIHEDRIEIRLKSDIDALIGCMPEESVNFRLDTGNISNVETGSQWPPLHNTEEPVGARSARPHSTTIIQSVAHRKDKVLSVSIISGGDPLEIYTNTGGEVIFKKYSPIGELSSFASQYADALAASTPLTVLICDRDHCIAAAGISKKEALERRITPAAEEMMETRRVVSQASSSSSYAVEGISRGICAAVPIISSGDVTGIVILAAEEEGVSATDTDIKLATVAASFLGKQLEE